MVSLSGWLSVRLSCLHFRCLIVFEVSATCEECGALTLV